MCIRDSTLRAYLPSSRTLHPATLGVTFLSSRIYPKGVSGAAGVLHESGCPTLVLSLWPWSHLFLLFIAAPGYRDLRPSHGVAPSTVFPTHGYRGTTLWLPCFSTVWSGDALVGRRLHLGDALPWRRLFLVTLALSVSSPRRRLVLTLTPGVDFDLDLVNSRVRDGTPIFLTLIIFIPLW